MFTRVFDSHSHQSEIFDHSAAPMLRRFMDGENCVIFAYGMTNAGKTHTIQGTAANPGILPRLVSAILDKKVHHAHTELHVSALEIYQENIYDLLGKRREKLNIRDAGGKVEVSKLSYHMISSTQDAFKLMDIAAAKRSKSSTFLNTGSSRSHAVYTLTLSKPSADGKEMHTVAFQLVDLAGAERG
jgi:kinesin family protein 22